jgi:hypothetical protein
MCLYYKLHDNSISVVHVYRGSTEHYWAGMSSHVGFYMIVVYDVGIVMWPGQIPLDLFTNLQVAWLKSWLVWPSSVGHVQRGAMILLSTRSCYFIDRDLRYCVNLVGQGFKPQTKQYDFLLVLGSVPCPDLLFQACVIRGICHSVGVNRKFVPYTYLT